MGLSGKGQSCRGLGTRLRQSRQQGLVLSTAQFAGCRSMVAENMGFKRRLPSLQACALLEVKRSRERRSWGGQGTLVTRTLGCLLN